MIEYLEKYLIKRNKALLMITHDRYFLERITNKIVEIDRGHLYEYNANYSAFIEMKAKREQDALNQEYKRKQFLKKELEWVRAGVQARTTKRKSRLQQFEKLSQIEDIQNVESVKMINTSSRLGKKTITLENVSKVYDGTPLFHPFSYQFKRFDRIGILGENGSGKTTLMNMIAQLDQDYEGTISIGETIRFGYFKQGVEDMDPSMRIIDYIKETSDFLETSEGTLTASAMCERFLFDKSMQFTRIERLSGGEKRRLYLLKVLMGAPNVLLLDEPTNDLDIDTLNILEDYLESFKGIIITVSHDRYFLDKIVDGLLVFKDHYVTYVNGGYSSQIDITSTKEKKESKKEAYRETKKQNQKRRLTWAEKKELESIDDVILDLENDIKKIDEEMQTTTEFEKLDELSSLRQEKEQELEEKNERYLELLEIEEG
jgi:ATP-binding cassette subfamily F protein uup